MAFLAKRSQIQMRSPEPSQEGKRKGLFLPGIHSVELAMNAHSADLPGLLLINALVSADSYSGRIVGHSYEAEVGSPSGSQKAGNGLRGSCR